MSGQRVHHERGGRNACRGGDEAERAGLAEPESRVVARVALQEHERLVTGRQRGECGADHLAADAGALQIGPNADRAEHQHIEHTARRVEERVAEQHLPHQLAAVFGDERQVVLPCPRVVQQVQQQANLRVVAEGRDRELAHCLELVGSHHSHDRVHRRDGTRAASDSCPELRRHASQSSRFSGPKLCGSRPAKVNVARRPSGPHE